MYGWINGIFKNFEEIVSSICLGGMALVITMQVFNRYVLQNSLDWSEEMGRYLFIWSVYIGCSYATLKDRHLEVTVIRSFVRPSIKHFIMGLSYLLTLAFCIVCVIYGTEMLNFLAMTGQKTPALEIKMYYLFACIPVGFALMAFRNAQMFWKLIRGTHPVYTLEKTGQCY
ncbi:MAG: TRAP transporter small permease [Desulfonatronovibrio sp.]